MSADSWTTCGGRDGYFCKDPDSDYCDPSWNPSCAPLPTEVPVPAVPTPVCEGAETLVKLLQYDSWGDGWGGVKLSLISQAGYVIYHGGLETGSEGVVYRCLGDGCYNVKVEEGEWGNEVTWEVRERGGERCMESAFTLVASGCLSSSSFVFVSICSFLCPFFLSMFYLSNCPTFQRFCLSTQPFSQHSPLPTSSQSTLNSPSCRLRVRLLVVFAFASVRFRSAPRPLPALCSVPADLPPPARSLSVATSAPTPAPAEPHP